MLSLIDAWIKAAVEHKTLVIKYYSRKTKRQTTVREVEPDYYGWSMNRKNFGLWGICRLRRRVRCFRPENVLDWKYVGNPFTPNPLGRWRELIPVYKKKRLAEKIMRKENVGAMPKKKSWTEKLADNKGLPKVEEITDKMSKRWGTGTVVIPAPIEVDAIMKKVPKGKLVTINEIRKALAKKHNATIGCPMTTGIFAWVAAHAAEEQRLEGKNDFTPYWRTLKTGGVINPKYPGGAEGQKELLEKEGHTVIQKGKKYVVADYEKSLIKL